MEAWLVEMAKGIGKFFLNPLLYWGVILVVIAGYKRVKLERKNFGYKIFDIFSELKNTGLIAVVFGLLISIITIGAGFVYSYEMVLLLIVVMIVLSISFRFSMLSAVYTLGITYIIILFGPILLDLQNVIDPTVFSTISLSSLSILLGLFLLTEAVLLVKVKRNETFPRLALSNRGNWVGEHQIKKLSFIPFFMLVPAGLITPFAPYWPYFSIGSESYSLLLFPFLIGVDYVVSGRLPMLAAKQLARSVAYLAFIVLVISVGSIFIPALSLLAVFVGILGKEMINYRHRLAEKRKNTYFYQLNEGLKVLGVIPGTPAERLGILVGETIVRVNGKKISRSFEFYEALQASGAFFKLDILDDNGEIRFLQSPFYEGEHYKLGIIFSAEPYAKQVN
ncbi:PDZ domain-containing protein [Virgibacillus sp. W0181]|uniref:PDZ domain-containing protein n=1 Tax=Virgibacillus sp. W0181 TaxID=3391581 RepID=UPI003F473EF2